MGIFYTHKEFFSALRSGDQKMVAKYLKRNAKKWLEHMDSCETPLEIALAKNNMSLLKLLMAAKPEPPARSWSSPVSLAARHGNIDALKIMLEAWPDALNKFSPWSPLGHALVNRHTKAAEFLIHEKKTDLKACNYLGYTRNMECFQMLIDAGCSVSQPFQDDEGDTFYPITSAARSAPFDIVKTMVEMGADVNIADRNGSALLQAVYSKRQDVIELLLQHGARNRFEDAIAYTVKENLPHLTDILKKYVKSPIPMATEDTETWEKVRDTEIMHIRLYPQHNRKLTEIFNFESCERILISENTALEQESTSQPQSFDGVSDAALRKAWDEFKKQGGEADETLVFKNRGIMIKKAV